MQKHLFSLCGVLVAGASFAVAQPPSAYPRPAVPPLPPQVMSFFITSVGMDNGANLGGLAGADQHCQTLAAKAGAGGLTWRAYLSTQGPGAVNARDRIGEGPWYGSANTRIARNLSQLHGDTLEEARIGNGVSKSTALTENG